MICSFLFAALLFFICSVPLFYLQRSSFLFAAFLFCIFAAVPFFVCSASFLFAAFLFCLQLSFFVCSVSLLFAAFLFCLQRFFYVCSVSLVGHRTKPILNFFIYNERELFKLSSSVVLILVHVTLECFYLSHKPLFNNSKCVIVHIKQNKTIITDQKCIQAYGLRPISRLK